MAEISRKIRNKKSLIGFVILLLSTLVVVTAFMLIGNVYSKYFHIENGQDAVLADEFYFESDYLTEEGATYVLSGINDTLTVTLKNHPDDLRYSTGEKIDYVLTANGAEITGSRGNLAGGSLSSQEIDIPIAVGTTYEVVATGTAGYTKTIRATFEVRDDVGVYKNIKDEDGCILLTVWAKNTSGDAEISFPDTLIPDNTDEYMADVKIADGKVIDNLNFTSDFSSHVYRFFKSNVTLTYAADDFDVTVGNITATEKEPEA